MSRDWKKFSNDELMGVWGSYMRTEFGDYNVLRLNPDFKRDVRITPMEMVKLVEELMDRLEIKNMGEDGNK